MLSNDTIDAGAHILLPAAAWGEKDGTITNSERCISRQRPFLPLPGEARPDWWIVSQVAQRMGFAEAFAFGSPADVFREHAALSCFENTGGRLFDIGAIGIDFGYANTTRSSRCSGRREPTPRRSGACSQTASSPRRTARRGSSRPRRRRCPPRCRREFPLRLNTGRLRDQWHTMTRTGRSPSLGKHRPAPTVEVHPLDAAAFGLKHDGFARVRTQQGACVLKVVVDPGQQRGSIFVPIHWSGADCASARIGDLVAGGTDPFSGQPECKATPAALARAEFAFQGYALTHRSLAWPADTWWARVAADEATGYLIATNDTPLAVARACARLFGPDAVLTQYVDPVRGRVPGRGLHRWHARRLHLPAARRCAEGRIAAGVRPAARGVRLFRRRARRHSRCHARPNDAERSKRSAARCAPERAVDRVYRN